jgi:hypothetical protein
MKLVTKFLKLVLLIVLLNEISSIYLKKDEPGKNKYKLDKPAVKEIELKVNEVKEDAKLKDTKAKDAPIAEKRVEVSSKSEIENKIEKIIETHKEDKTHHKKNEVDNNKTIHIIGIYLI